MYESKKQVVHEINQPHAQEIFVVFWCPGCRTTHLVRTKRKPGSLNGLWTWNEDTNAPTIHPTVLVGQSDPRTRCHSRITKGYIEYMNDCAHHLAGQTTLLPSFVWREA